MAASSAPPSAPPFIPPPRSPEYEAFVGASGESSLEAERHAAEDKLGKIEIVQQPADKDKGSVSDKKKPQQTQQPTAAGNASNKKSSKEKNRGCFQIPVLCILMTIVNTVMLAVSLGEQGGIEPMSINPMVGPSASILSGLGAKNDTLIRQGELWRLITPMFLHAGVIHWAINTVMLWVSIRVVELHIFGTWRTTVVYVLSGIAGNLASSVFLPDYLSVGASSSIFGCLGAAFAESLLTACCAPYSGLVDQPLLERKNVSQWRVQKRAARRSAWKRLCTMFWQIVLLVFIGLLPFVDNFAHLGGLLEGMFLGLAIAAGDIYREKYKRRKDASCYYICVEVIFSVVAVLCLLVGLVILFLPLNSPHEWCPFCR